MIPYQYNLIPIFLGLCKFDSGLLLMRLTNLRHANFLLLIVLSVKVSYIKSYLSLSIFIYIYIYIYLFV